jgi:hypothetical protein
MPESSLSLQLSDFASEVGSFLGFGRTPANWSGWVAATPYVPSSLDSQLAWIMACIQGGLRQFYYPQSVDGGPIAHKWSFLSPQRILTVVAGQGVYDLPDDFGSMEGEFTYQSTDSTWYTVRRCGIGEISRNLQMLFGIQDKPTKCATYPKQTDGSQGQRFQVSFAPIPDSTYNLTYTSNLLPQMLSNSNPYPYGGAFHGETILESCLAVAESRFQDEANPQSTHRMEFEKRLQASITVDIRDFKPAYLGYNADRSDQRSGPYPWGPWLEGWGPTLTVGATYDGVQY